MLPHLLRSATLAARLLGLAASTIPTAVTAVTLASLALPSLVLPSLALAQPRGMPNVREISGRPLPDRGMPPGTVSVRVARQSMANPVTNTEVVGIVEAAGGESRKRTSRTDGEGRAIFEGLRPGDRFHAEVAVGADLVKSDTFTIPEAGGIRTMLVGEIPPDTGEASAEAQGAEAAPPAFTLGMISGTTRLDPALERGTIAVTALDEAGHPIADQVVELGEVAADGQVRVNRQTTDASGKTTFDKIGQIDKIDKVGGGQTSGAGAGATGGAAGTTTTTTTTAAAVVMSVGGVRVGTDGFGIPPSGGIRVELRVPQRTADPSAITVGEGGRIVFQMRDEAVSFIETLPLQNGSGKIFDPGPGGIEVPLPSEAVNAEGADGEHKIEVRKGIGVAIHGIIPPRRPVAPNQKSPDEVTFGFVLPVRGSTLGFEQRFPNGMGEYTFVMEQLAGLGVESDQITGRQDREFSGKKYWLLRGASIPPGGTLRFKVTGLPVGDETGKIVAAALAVGLALAAAVLSRRPTLPAGAAGAARQGERERLLERREKLFAELVNVEARRTATPPTTSAPAVPDAPGVVAPTPPSGLTVLRNDLVRKLENVYRELATLDERRAS